MTTPAMTDEDREVLRDLLLQWQTAGVQDPIMPSYVDEDGDGVVDFWGLSELGHLERREGPTDGFNVAAELGATGAGIEGQPRVSP